jgi:hypothetical protein
MHTIGLHHLLFAETRKNLLVMLRYPLQPIIGLLILAAVFGAISFGIAKYPTLDLFDGGDKRVLVASFFCWVIAMGSVGHIAAELEEDIKTGLLEPIFLSRHPASAVILVRSLASSGSGLLLSFATLAILVWYAAAPLHLGVSTLLALILLDVSLSSIGLVMAGIVILFKRAASIAPLFYLGFGVLIAKLISLQPNDKLFLYPISSSVELFTRTLFGSDIPLSGLLCALAWAVLILACGIALLRLCIGRARRMGTLSHY